MFAVHHFNTISSLPPFSRVQYLDTIWKHIARYIAYHFEMDVENNVASEELIASCVSVYVMT